MSDEKPSRKVRCKNCAEKDKEIAMLKKRIMQLRPEKTHFDMDGYNTPCRLDVFSVNASADIEEVTCRNCLSAWEKMKKGWNKEESKDRRTNR